MVLLDDSFVSGNFVLLFLVELVMVDESNFVVDVIDDVGEDDLVDLNILDIELFVKCWKIKVNLNKFCRDRFGVVLNWLFCCNFC